MIKKALHEGRHPPEFLIQKLPRRKKHVKIIDINASCHNDSKKDK